jgi:propionyl-CoA carboxylase alpha chain
MLVAVLESPAFLDGATTTAFLDEHPELLAPLAPDDVVRRHLVAVGCLLLGDARCSGALTPPRGWRNVAGVPSLVHLAYRHGTEQRTAQVGHAWSRDGDVLWLCPSTDGAAAPAQTLETDPRFERIEGARLEKRAHRLGTTWFLEELARLELDGVRVSVAVDIGDAVLGDAAVGSWDDDPSRVVVSSDGWTTAFVVVEPWASSGHDAAGGGPTTPVPGTVTHVAVAVGDAVAAGAALVVLEAMKMEHTIRADADGVVTEVHVSVGQSVDAHTVVATLTPTEPTP